MVLEKNVQRWGKTVDVYFQLRIASGTGKQSAPNSL